MLVLVRREKEDVIISDRKGTVIAIIKLIEAVNGMCKLGFSAEDEIEVNREEIYERKFKNKSVNYAR